MQDDCIKFFPWLLNSIQNQAYLLRIVFDSTTHSESSNFNIESPHFLFTNKLLLILLYLEICQTQATRNWRLGFLLFHSTDAIKFRFTWEIYPAYLHKSLCSLRVYITWLLINQGCIFAYPHNFVPSLCGSLDCRS